MPDATVALLAALGLLLGAAALWCVGVLLARTVGSRLLDMLSRRWALADRRREFQALAERHDALAGRIGEVLTQAGAGSDDEALLRAWEAKALAVTDVGHVRTQSFLWAMETADQARAAVEGTAEQAGGLDEAGAAQKRRLDEYARALRRLERRWDELGGGTGYAASPPDPRPAPQT